MQPNSNSPFMASSPSGSGSPPPFNNAARSVSDERKVHFIPREDGFDMNTVARHFEEALKGSSTSKSESDTNTSDQEGLNLSSDETCEARQSAGDVSIDHYILAYRELERFFELMGSIFGFVGADVKDKLEILQQHRQSEQGRHYQTVQSMMEYEKHLLPDGLEPKRISPDPYRLPSASRTLLRLHRALEFIMIFMDALITANDDEGVGPLAQECYKRSLARYHGWIIRNGALLAMYTLPTKYRLMERISKYPYDQCSECALRMTIAMKPIFDRTQKFYTDYRLHDLP